MKWTVERNLASFEPWGGAVNVWSRLIVEEIDKIESWMEEVEWSWSETEINDFFWFDLTTIAEILGDEDEDALWERIDARYKKMWEEF